MNETSQTKEKIEPLQNKNILERIIKLDKKNSSLSLYDKKKNKRIVIRNNNLNSTIPWAANQNEQNLRNFWRHVNQYYFKRIEEHDLERTDYLLNLLNNPIKDPEVKYADPQAYWTFKEIISYHYKNLYNDDFLNKLNIHDLQKQYKISLLTNPLTTNINKVNKNLLKLAQTRHKPPNGRPEKKSVKSLLIDEAKTLDSIMETIDDDPEEDDITTELKKLMEEQSQINYGNVKMLTDLKQKAKSDLPSYLISYEKSIDSRIDMQKFEIPESKHDPSAQSKRKNLAVSEIIDTQIRYLKNLILSLENRQVGESMKFVLDVKKPESHDGKHKYLVAFDDALTTKEVWIDENIFDELDKLREQSLFKIYNIPQKSVKNITSHNVIGFHYCQEKIKNKTTTLKEKPWRDLFKKRINDKFDSFNKEDAIAKIKEYGICHHCKCLFPNDYLLKCNYRSSAMGLPVPNPAYVDALSNSAPGGKRTPKRNLYTNKRSVYSFYVKKSGELFCMRKFCRTCLKQNYDQNLAEVCQKHDWVCPFCQGNCYCSRCLRNDHLNKLMSMFVILGGDILDIKKESNLEKYIYTHDMDSIIKKVKTMKYALKPTSLSKESSIIKMKIKKFKDLLKKFAKYKALRVHLEKVRFLCSQVIKREKLKSKLDMLTQEAWEQQLEDLDSNISFIIEKKEKEEYISDDQKLIKKRKKKSQSQDRIEPPVSKAMKNNDGKKVVIHDSNNHHNNNNNNHNSTAASINNLMDLEEDGIIQPKLEEDERNTEVPKIPKKRGRKPKNWVPPSTPPPVHKETPSEKRSSSKKKKQQLSISKENPNEPNDNYDDGKPFKLKRELQRIMQNQSLSDFLMMNTFPWDSGRITRTALCKNKLRGTKNYHFKDGL